MTGDVGVRNAGGGRAARHRLIRLLLLRRGDIAAQLMLESRAARRWEPGHLGDDAHDHAEGPGARSPAA